MREADFDSEEKEFQQQIATRLSVLRSTVGACPHPDQIQAASVGVDFEGVERVRQHLQICPVCRQLSRDLSIYEFPDISAEEDRRIRARLPLSEGISSRDVSWWAWLWRPLPMAAAAAIIAVVAVTGLLKLRTPAVNVEQTAKSLETVPASPAARTAFVLQKAAIKVPAAAVLTFRSGADSGKVFVDDLAAALTPYRSDDYSNAAPLLEALAQKYPKSIESFFYLGVSRLFLNENGKAVDSLSSAQSLPGDDLRDDVSWYLALALDRVGRTAEAGHELDKLCMSSSEFRQRACAAAQELRR
jgi:tetratricopeptide (TPR) repeat protein